ncbi:MAG TPA: PAS domain S-box protein [Thermoflexia bacterium]|nr:PAS domain S-box protein [Thermoflexia bacterium]
MITFENTTVLNLIFAPTAELLHSEIVHANRTFLLGLLFSGITLSAVYVAQNFNTIAILSELRYRNLFEASQDAIFIINLQGEYQDVNPAATEMVGYSLLELQEMLVDDLRIPSAEVSPEVRSRMWREGGMQELSLRHKDGHPIPVDLVVSPIREGEVQKYVLGIVRDISERKRAEKELQKYRDHLEELVEIRTVELEAVNAELKDFAYVVSHDLKAPLRAITQLGSWIATDYAEALDADGRELVDLLIGRTRRMHGLIQGILQYSRIGRVVEKKRSVNLNQLVQETLEMLAPPASIQITVTNELPTVVGERARLRQVFQNLLDNALKFMDKPQGWVRIGCADAGDYWLFSVADNGPGIAAKYYAKIFQIFQTLVPRDEFESTGIGLALVKKIVELNEGKVWVESTVGAGSTFYFTLPKQEEER